MHILFSVRNTAYVRHYDRVIRALAARGHTIDLIIDGGRKERPWPAHVAQIAHDHPSVRLDRTPSLSLEPWYELATAVRQNLFHARFLEADYADTPVLLQRAAEKAPAFARRLLESRIGRLWPVRRATTGVLRLIERSTPVPADIVSYLAARQPDVVVLTPLVVLKTVQLDLLRAARLLGIPTIWAVASWDHLSSKGLLHDLPDRVVVWNQTQRDEAIRLHAVPADRIVVTGAQVFDEWFAQAPALDRAAFCARVGLRADRPYILYVGSALFEGSPSEGAFAQEWLRAIRNRPGLADAGVLFRPHFKRAEDWATVDASRFGNAVVWPPAGEVPVDAASRHAYFDSLYHAAAVVGLNTSALIEAGILGKPVLTVLLPEYYGNQEGTIHFRYLSQGPPPLLHTARDLAAHAEQLDEVVTGRDRDPGRSERFVRHFVRPGASGTPATAQVVAAIEGAVASAGAVAHRAIPQALLVPLARIAVERVERQHAKLRRIDEAKRLAKIEAREQRRAEREATRRAGS